MKKLYRSNNRTVAGICGGFGEYYNVDPTLLRVFAAVAIVCTGVFPGVFLYILGIFIIPNKPE